MVQNEFYNCGMATVLHICDFYLHQHAEKYLIERGRVTTNERNCKIELDDDEMCFGLLWRIKATKELVDKTDTYSIHEHSDIREAFFENFLAHARKECIEAVDAMAELHHSKSETGDMALSTIFKNRRSELKRKHDHQKPYYAKIDVNQPLQGLIQWNTYSIKQNIVGMAEESDEFKSLWSIIGKPKVDIAPVITLPCGSDSCNFRNVTDDESEKQREQRIKQKRNEDRMEEMNYEDDYSLSSTGSAQFEVKTWMSRKKQKNNWKSLRKGRWNMKTK